MRLYAVIVSEESDLPETYLLKGLGKALKQIERLETMVADAWAAIVTENQARPVASGYQSVFVAPEYFFSNQRHMQDRFFSQEVKQTIISRLSALAKQYPKLLIVPGTVLSTKELYDRRLKMLGRGQSQEIKTLKQNRLQKAVARIQTASTYGTETNQRDWSNTRDIATTDRKLAQNVVYVCLGTQVVKYHKVGNYKEVEGETDDLLFVPGSLVGRFNVGGVKYGLEVCMDHALGVLDSTVPSQGAVDIQIIVSSYVGCKINPNASVTLHASTEADSGYVDSNDDMWKTTGTKQIRFGGDKLSKMAGPPIKKPAFTIWPIDLTSSGITNVSSYKINNTALQSVKTIH